MKAVAHLRKGIGGREGRRWHIINSNRKNKMIRLQQALIVSYFDNISVT